MTVPCTDCKHFSQEPCAVYGHCKGSRDPDDWGAEFVFDARKREQVELRKEARE